MTYTLWQKSGNDGWKKTRTGIFGQLKAEAEALDMPWAIVDSKGTCWASSEEEAWEELEEKLGN